MADTFAQVVPETQKPSVLYSYPVTCIVLVKAQTVDGEFHLIYAPDAVTASTDLTGAPNGSILIQPSALQRKDGTFGAKDGTWKTYGAGT